MFETININWDAAIFAARAGLPIVQIMLIAELCAIIGDKISDKRFNVAFYLTCLSVSGLVSWTIGVLWQLLHSYTTMSGAPQTWMLTSPIVMGYLCFIIGCVIGIYGVIRYSWLSAILAMLLVLSGMVFAYSWVGAQIKVVSL